MTKTPLCHGQHDYSYKCPSVVSSPRELREGATHASQSEFWLIFYVFQATLAENVSPPRSKSFSGLCSSFLRPDRDVRTCTDNRRASRLQTKVQRCYLGQNIGPAVAGSAGPAPPPLILGAI